MVCSKAQPIPWMCGLILVVAGFGVVVISPSISFAQYPGSAGDLTMGAFSGSSSATNGSVNGPVSGSLGTTDVSSTKGSAGDVSLGLEPSKSDDSQNGQDRDATPAVARLLARKATRKRALIRKFQLEFAKTLTIEAAYQRPLEALSADRYLDQFSRELDEGVDRQADIESIGQDLALVRDAIDDRLDVVIASYSGGDIQRRGLFARKTPIVRSVPALRAEIGKIALKHELLEFGEYGLQAMGYYAE